ncbi:MAG: DUF6785 family protein [Armatimonadota bacterium]
MPDREPLRAVGRRARFVTWRAVLTGLLLIPITSYCAAAQGVDVILSLMVPPVSCLILLVLFNAVVRPWKPSLCFTEGELVVIYGMLVVATAIAAEWVTNIQPLIASYVLFANETNQFESVMLPNIPDFLFIKDRQSVLSYLSGGHSFRFMLANLSPWVVPVLCWTAFVSLLAIVMLCINSLMREQWTQREKLSFPVIQLPVAMAHDGGASPFWRNRNMWIAFTIMAAIDIVNGFAFLYPSVPRINVRFLGDLSRAFRTYPWNSVGWTPIGLFPFITAMCLFLPSDLLFSSIFFFFVRKAQQVVAASLGYSQGVFGGGWLVPSPPYFSEQSWGAFLGLFIMAIWIARGYLKELWNRIRFGERGPVDGISARSAFAGLILGLAGLGYFGHAIGISVPFALFYCALFLAFSVALTRMRAELGPPTHEMAFMGPNQLIVDFAGSQALPRRYIPVLASVFHFMNRIHRTDPMPGQLEAMKMGERSPGVQKSIFFAILLAIIAGNLAGHGVRIYQGYRWGAPAAGYDTAQVAVDLLNNPRRPNATAVSFVGIGMGVVFALNFLRFRFPWFPLNPVGYALAMNFGVDYYWFGMLVAFVVKTLTQRYGGLKAYRKLHGIALGIILGEMAVETIWMAIAVIWRIPTYSISINGRLGWDQ